jgi:beta-xylosidase
MYYCIVVDNYIKTGKAATTENFDNSWTERSFIGVMETATPANVNSWKDKGFVLCSMSDKGQNWTRNGTNDWSGYFRYNAIDPSYIITPEGEHWLIYGSWHSGFAAVQLNPATGKTIVDPLPNPWGAANEAAYGKLIYTRKAGDRWQAAEAPEVVYHDGYYYLFMAFDALDVPYNTRVLRSERIDGPYYDQYGTQGTAGGGQYPIVTHPYKFAASNGWVGISHCAVFDDGQGNWFYASQQRFPTTAGGNAPNAVMMGGVRAIRWTDDGWPLVMPERYGGVVQAEITDADIVGTWEHIDLGYSYGNQKASSEMTFGANHRITDGIWKGGTWSFDPSTNVLTANGVKCYLQRECDWESSPRKATIVYAALGNRKSYWGKKKN